MMDGFGGHGWGMENGLGWGLIIVVAILVVVIGIYAKMRKKL
jgi:hypothetical protein